MINARDLILLGLILGAMLIAVIWPQAGNPFRPYTTFFMMGLLFLSFLPISMESIARTALHMAPRLIGWLLLKLVLLPVALFFLFRAVYPDYAMAALLLGGASTGVVAPFFSSLVGANTALVVLMVTAGSVLVPFTLPVLVRVAAGQTIDISFAAMALSLAQVIFVPLAAAEFLRYGFPAAPERISARSYSISVFFCVVIVLGVFSKYSSHIHRNPSMVVDALLVALLLSLLLFAAGMLVSLGEGPADRLAAVISLGLINNILVVAFSSEFCGPIEPLVSAIYCVPFFCSIVFLRGYAGWLAGGATGLRRK
ncbi:MAG: bile acid:sodium symporter family protein [Syntrophobacteraceae bacterium]